MDFVEALRRLVEYSTPNSKFENAFFCITNDELLLDNRVLIIERCEGLCGVVLSFAHPNYNYMNIIKSPVMVPIRYLTDKTWKYFTTWEDVEKACNNARKKLETELKNLLEGA